MKPPCANLRLGLRARSPGGWRRPLAAGLSALLLLPLCSGMGQPAPARQRRFRFTYRATVRSLPAGAKRLDLWMPYPQSDANQTVHRVTIDAPGPVSIGREAAWGNQVLACSVPAPRSGVTLQLTIEATRRENRGAAATLAGDERRACLEAEPLVPLDGPVGELARQAVEGETTPLGKARAIYEKVTTLLKYDKSGTGWGRGDARFACDARRGNCTDFHALLTGMARSQGLPARFAIGFSLPEARGEGEVAGYHCWAEMYVDGQGWIPVDSSEGARALAAGRPDREEYFFGHHDENRIEFSRGRNLELDPRQRGGPVNFFVYPYAEVDGRPHAAVETRFRYADLPDSR